MEAPLSPLAPKTRQQYKQMTIAAAKRHGISPEIFAAQINWESGFNPKAVSPAGAVGIAQIVPKWHPKAKPRDPEAALDYAARMNARNLKTYKGSWGKTLAAYNAGCNAVKKWGGIPPFKETQDYVAGILKAAKKEKAKDEHV